MAETGKGVTAGKLAITVQKRLSRAQEKVLQKLGKADETRDEVFEEMVANFNKQMGEGTKLQKDLKAYLTAVKTMHETSRRLQDCLADMYEPEWFGKEEMDALVEDTDTQWLDFHQNVTDNSVLTMDSYLAQFADIKARIAKRDRKMVDFDSARHHFSSLQKGKKKDEAKIAKAEEELGRAQKIFEELNVELQDQLPVLWDSRVGVYVNTFQSLAGHQERFHREMSKLSQNLNDIMTKLEEQRQLKKDGTTAAKTAAAGKSEEANHSRAATSPTRPGPPPSRPPPSLRPQHDESLDDDIADVNAEPRTPQECSWDSWHEQTAADDEEHPQEQLQVGWDYNAQTDWDRNNAQLHSEPTWHDDGASVGPGGWGDDEVQSSASNSSEYELPPGFLYKVKAIHEYAATDGDELELTIGDVVLVLAFDNPDEQDDGWLMGVQESVWKRSKDISSKGVFPENFTQKF
ncbi:myc box-dependent-interacting protein 1b isoform X5 [Dunckerocampus dactyliophorus]|uniref:myc box-dependent-interacting protein 1b isoform X5 n=1 Tax=Dunckerocampus dactyliophorus TaxID=161453 RepID=UPI002404B1A7|nr:myc box-dependent-interacting protein 1b isoform X5 [Dunckerocampus dactyliophorus]